MRNRYESLPWQTLDRWLAANREHPQEEEFEPAALADATPYLRGAGHGGGGMGWAILGCRLVIRPRAQAGTR